MENKADKSAQAQEKMNRMKYEIANELGIDLKQGYIGGYMVKKMIEDVERKNSSK